MNEKPIKKKAMNLSSLKNKQKKNISIPKALYGLTYKEEKPFFFNYFLC